jgi:flavin reductase (DIM6/NTAB) family NADH-FMN oxidoreductase RutF
MKEKITYPTGKQAWQPSPLLGQIVLVTTLNEDGVSNVAPKSWISMVAFHPPLLALGCSSRHQTAQNILARKEFVVNVPGSDLAEAVWKCSRLPHPRPVESAGLTPLAAQVIAPPLVEECKAHLECVYRQHLSFGSEVLIIGEIVSVSIDKEVISVGDPYASLKLIAFLENGCYGVIDKGERIESE